MNTFFKSLEDTEKLLSKAQEDINKVEQFILNNKDELYERLKKLVLTKNQLAISLKAKREEFLKTLVRFCIALGIQDCPHGEHSIVELISVDQFRLKNNVRQPFNLKALIGYLDKDYNQFCKRIVSLIEGWLSDYPETVDGCVIDADQLVSMKNQLIQIFEKAPDVVS